MRLQRVLASFFSGPDTGKRVVTAFFVGICAVYTIVTLISLSNASFNDPIQLDSPLSPINPLDTALPANKVNYLNFIERGEDETPTVEDTWVRASNDSSNDTAPTNNESSEPYLWTLPDVVLSSVTVFLGALICAGAGVGGGAFNLAAYILFLNMSTHNAVPLSKATILGVAIGGYLVTYRKRHPTVNRPLIDYETTLLMEPFALVGSVFGVFFNVAFPEYIILICLVLLLSVTAYKTFQKGWTTYKKEKATAAQKAAPVTPIALSEAEEGHNDAHLSINDSRDNYVPLDAAMNQDTKLEMEEELNYGDVPLSLRAASSVKEEKVLALEDSTSDELEALLEHEKGIPLLVALALFLTWACFVVAIFFAGFKGKSVIGVECGSPLFWVILSLAFVFLTVITYIQAFRLARLYKRKVYLSYPFADGDLKWSGKKPYLFPWLCVIAGWTAGFLGVGGGLVQGPILLQMGMQAQVATITSSFMILFTASSTTLQYAILGKIPWQFGLWYGAMAFMGAIIGQLALAEFIKRTGKASFAVLILGVMEVVSMLAIGGLGIKQIIAHEVSMDFQWICQ